MASQEYFERYARKREDLLNPIVYRRRDVDLAFHTRNEKAPVATLQFVEETRVRTNAVAEKNRGHGFCLDKKSVSLVDLMPTWGPAVNYSA